jgi:hypothetical protein
MADGGTLFLDEIGDLDATLQTKLLRVLQDGRYERVGGSETLTSRARVVAATNKPVRPGQAGATLRRTCTTGWPSSRWSSRRSAPGGATSHSWWPTPSVAPRRGR